jgi:hypothetical protein
MYGYAKAEQWLEKTLLAGKPGQPQFSIPTVGVPTPLSRSRKVDFAEQLPTGELLLHEVKAGTAPTHGKGRIAGVHWHFTPHGSYNSLGPSQELLDCLIAKGISFTIHTPDV